MHIAVFEHEDWMEEYLLQHLQGHQLSFSKDPLTSTNASQYQDAQIVCVFVFSRIDAAVLDQLPKLKMIATRSTGFDHVDLAACKERSVTVTNVPRYGSVTVAEHTWALILALTRNIHTGYERTERTDFSLEGLRGFDLMGKTLGLIGLGEIGRNVAFMSKGFTMKLRIFSRSRDDLFASQFDNSVFVDSIDDVYTHADVISFHVPLTPETHHLLNCSNYEKIKPGAIVVNTSRGGIIETKALIKALQSGRLRGAALDVLESEELLKNETQLDVDTLPGQQELSEAFMDHILLSMDNVIITPHNAFNSDESIRRLVDAAIRNISHYSDNQLDKLDVVA